MSAPERKSRDLTRLETLSAWLGFWKPRDVEVPPVPKRRLAVAGAILVLLMAGAALVAIPAIDSGKDEAAEREGRDAAEARAAERARLEADQAAHRSRGPRDRDALLARVRESIETDARARVRTGTLDGRILRVECEPGRRAGSRASYDCTAVTSEIPETGRNVPGVVGHPFVVVVDFSTGRYSWCKTNPVPGERVIPDPRDVVALPDECVL
jgi:hypothetical protein